MAGGWLLSVDLKQSIKIILEHAKTILL